MKVNILFEFKDGAWGGGNQFLKAIRSYFIQHDYYVDSTEGADVILFNLNPSSLRDFLWRVYEIKKSAPDKIIIARLDGPIQLIREGNSEYDKAFFKFTQFIADGVIYQSEWSRNNCLALGQQEERFQTTIINAPDPGIFNRKQQSVLPDFRKIKLIATSWSSNWKKGFEVYKWLDDNLDFSKYDMTFIGNAPCNFTNIKTIDALPSSQLANKLKGHDIFITASQQDPCSNSLIEALHCGLPALVLNDGGHPEILGNGGLVFTDKEEIPERLDQLCKEFQKFFDSIDLPMIEEVGELYAGFASRIYGMLTAGKYVAKAPQKRDFISIEKIIGRRSRGIHGCIRQFKQLMTLR